MEVHNIKMEWKVERINRPEDIFKDINKKMPQPVGIVLFGTDHYLKMDICREFLRTIENLQAVNCSPNLKWPVAKSAIIEGMNILIVLSNDQSETPSIYHKIATELNNLGVKTIIGVYVASGKMKLRNPPTAANFNYLITI